MKMTGLDAELAEQIKNLCFGKGKRKKKIFVDLVRDNTKEAAKDTLPSRRTLKGRNRIKKSEMKKMSKMIKKKLLTQSSSLMMKKRRMMAQSTRPWQIKSK